jgi:murein L,D-transpeptidase YafK
MLTAAMAPVDAVGQSLESGPGRGALLDFREEMSVRWRHERQSMPTRHGLVPSSILMPAASSRHLVFVDLTRSRLILFENDGGRLRPLRDFYVTMGLNGGGKEREGDKRTPIGVYHITSYIPGARLDDRYGPGALPISYPNSLDRRMNRTGYGIWIHGTESEYINRAPRASDGCLSLNNSDFLELSALVDPRRRIPVVIDADPRWVPASSVVETRHEFLQAIEAWRRDWESTDVDRYLAHYQADEFATARQGFRAWARHKRSISRFQEYISVTINDLELFAYPGSDNVYVADFLQQFESNTFSGRVRKKQYWRRENDGRWKIVFESDNGISAPPAIVRDGIERDRGEHSRG